MTSNVVALPNTIIHKFVKEKLEEMLVFEPCAYYISSVDILVVLVSDRPFNLEHKSAEGSMYYTRTSPKHAVGFQISGVRHFLKDETSWQRRWDMATLVKTLALKAGGLPALFGKSADDVHTMLRTWKISVNIKPNPD